MRELKTSHLLWGVVAVVVFIALGMTLYVHQADMMLARMTAKSMQEIADHDMAFVENTLNRSWSGLSDLAQRLRAERCGSLEELQIRLNIERSGSSYQNLYLVDSSGKTYSGAYLVTDGRKRPWVQDILARRPVTVRRLNRNNYRVDDQQEILIYAVSSEPFSVGGVTFLGIAGQTNIRDMRRRMSLSSFGGRGSSYVVDADGNYIVNESDVIGIGARANLFKQLAGADFQSGCSLEKLQKDVADGRDVSCTFSLNGESFMLCMQHFKSAPWHLAVMVPENVFAQQSRKFLLLTGVMLFLALLAVLLVLMVSLRAWRTTLKARAAAAAESEFLSRMSHEIRTPLNALIGLNYLMKKDLHNADQLAEYLDKSESTSQYLLSLVNDILDISKFRQDKADFASSPFSLKETAALVQMMMKGRMDEKGISFDVRCELPHPCVVGDGMRLKQVIINLLSNAVKFTPQGGKVTLSLTQEPAEGSRVLTNICVEDNGIGMSREFQERIFESFTQEKRPESAENRGTGLGMAISYLIMKQMGGSLTVTSKVGCGSLFTATLPAEISDTGSEPEVRPAQSARAEKRLRVLIAEDNELNAMILSNILEKEGCSSVVAENGRRAVELFRSSAPGEFSLVLMDAQMPVMDGFEAATAIRRLDRPDASTVPIIACTANTSQNDRDRAGRVGMNGFLAKPIDVDELLKFLKDAGRGDSE